MEKEPYESYLKDVDEFLKDLYKMHGTQMDETMLQEQILMLERQEIELCNLAKRLAEARKEEERKLAAIEATCRYYEAEIEELFRNTSQIISADHDLTRIYEEYLLTARRDKRARRATL